MNPLPKEPTPNLQEKFICLLHSPDKTNIALALEMAKGLPYINLDTLLKEYLTAYQFLRNRYLRSVDISPIYVYDNITNIAELEIRHLLKVNNATGFALECTSLDIFPAETGYLHNLETLYLSDNQLTTVSPVIGQLQYLKELCLDSNQLKSLPAEIGQLQKLEVLWLQDNELTALPPEIGQLASLKKLLLNSNKLTTLPLQTGHLKNLKELTMDAVLEEEQEKIKSWLPNCKIEF